MLIRWKFDPQGHQPRYANIENSSHNPNIAGTGIQGLTLNCGYGYGSQTTYFFFWYQYRPDIPTEKIAEAATHGWYADVAAEKCPERFKDAIILGFGKDALETFLRSRDEYNAKQDAQIKQAGDYQASLVAWAKGAVLLPQETLRKKIADLDVALAVLASKGRSPNEPDFHQAMKTIDPLLLDVARSGMAQAQAIPKGEAGRKQFDAWDNGPAKAIMQASTSLQKYDRGLWSNYGPAFHKRCI